MTATATTPTDSTVAKLSSSLSSVTISQQMLTLASSTIKFAASALRFSSAHETANHRWTHLPIYTLEQVGWHDTKSDCWIVLYDKVYNITTFLSSHPGGYDVLLEQAGRDATIAFRGVGHSIDAVDQLEEFIVGVLPINERIYLR